MKKLLQIIAVTALLTTPAMAYAEMSGHGHDGSKPHHMGMDMDKVQDHKMDAVDNVKKQEHSCDMNEDKGNTKCEGHMAKGEHHSHDKGNESEQDLNNHHKKKDGTKGGHKADDHAH